MAGLTATIKAAIAYKKTGAPDLGQASAAYDGHADIQVDNGTGNNQADLVFSDQRTLTASSTETLDLSSLVGPLGEAVAFAKIKAILIKASPNNTNSVIVGAAGSNPFLGPLGGTTPTLTIPPGGEILLAAPKAGWAVSTAVNLKLANSSSGSSVIYDIIITGTSA